MAMFTYRGLNKAGREVKSTISSENLLQAKQKIKSMGIMLIDISEQSTPSSTKNKGGLRKKIKVEDLSLMTRQLATLIKAKIQVVEALAALTEQVENPALKVVLSELKNKVNEGSSLSRSLADYPKVFDTVYVNMVEADETSGNLEVVLLRLAEFTESRVKLKNKLKGALTYPVLMAGFGTLMIGVIFTQVIPKIADILISMDKELPIQTEFCIWLSKFLLDYWWMVLIGIFLFYQTFSRYLKTAGGKSRWHRLQLNLPIFGNLIKMVNISRFASTLATLLNSGVPILTSMTIVRNLVPNVHMQEAIAKAKENVSEGKTLTTPLIQSGYFPPMVTHMIRLGEQSGELEPMLEIVSSTYEDQVNNQLSGLTALLEPIMLIFMGLIVAFVVFSVVVPIMEVNSIK